MLMNQIRQRLVRPESHQAQPLNTSEYREAAVLMAITRGSSPHVIFIKRAEKPGNHSGQVAFPGGMWEPEDTSLIHTALRESEEEIALPPTEVELVGVLEPLITRFDVRVSPFVGLIPEGLQFVPELAELDEVFQVPLDHLLQRNHYQLSRFDTVAGVFEAPCILFQQHRIWGVTYHVLMEMLQLVFEFDPGIRQESVAVENP